MQNTICTIVDVCALKTKLNTKTLLVVLFSLVLAACESSSSGSDGDPTDTTAPVIIMLGADPLSLSVGDTYIDPGATATDDTDGDITVSIVVAGDTVNTAIEASYVVTYDVSDAAGNDALQVTRTVIVDDTVPVITLLGTDPIKLMVGDTYADPGVTATDNVDGDISGNIVVAGDTVNTAIEGAYVVTYDISDAAGNAAVQISRTVIVDGSVPVISLLGSATLNLMTGDTYTDPGASATDDIDGDITSDIVVAGDTVNTAIEGTYVVTYDVSDAVGNAAVQVTRTVNVGNDDVTPPVITLLGSDPLKLMLGDTYADPGTNASDNFDGGISGNIVVAGDTVNTAIEGTYVVTYDVSDAAGNVATQVTRTVIVDGTVPVITPLGADPLELSVGETYTDPGATASDDVDDNISGNIVVGGDAVDTSVIAAYIVTYDVSDSAGNSAVQVTRTVNVVNDSPLINALSMSPDPAFINSAATFIWDVSDINGDTLTCQLDVDNDGTDDYTINDCVNTATQGHTFTVAGDYTVKLTVDDGIAPAVIDTLSFTVISPLSMDVAVNGPAVAGERVLYTINVGNTTLLPIENVNVSLVVPSELSFSASTDAEPNADGCGNGGCNPTEEVVWALDTLAAGESRTIVVNALVNVSTLAGVSIVLPVTFSATNINNVLINKSVEVFNTPSADLALSASTDPVVANETFIYQLDFGNTSAGVLTNTELRAFLPAGLTINTISDGGSEVATGEVVWDEDSVSVGASLHREITVTADTVIAGQILKATTQLTHDGGQVVDNTSEHALTVVSSALPLHVDISTSANSVVSEERVLYTLTVSNTSLQQVNTVSVQFRIPTELTFSASTDAEPNADGCGNGGCNPTEEAAWTLSNLAAGESRTIVVNAFVDSVLSGNLISTPVRVTATDLGDTINLLKTVALYNTPSADLALSASTDPVVPNETFTYQLDFGNTSADALTNTELRAFLPAGVTINTISDGGSEVATGEVVWDEGSVSVGASLHREITVTADTVIAGQILKATTQLTHDGGQAVDNTAEHALTVVSSALPLHVDISSSANSVVSEERVLYTLTVSNTSLLPVNTVSVQFRIPTELSFSASTDAEPNADGCGNGGCNPTEEAAWTLGNLAAGESRTIVVNAFVDSVLSGNLISTPVRVTATDLGDTIDLLKTVALYNTPSADLALSASTDPVVPNETFTYQLDFGNTSADALTNTELRAFLPTGVTINTISDGGSEVATGEVVWDEDSVSVGASLHREITVTADTVIAGQILKATTQLTHDGGQAVDNTSEHALTVVSSALPLHVDISTSANPVVTDSHVLYTLTVSNTSLQQVNTVSVQFRIPAELSFSASTDAEPNADGCGNGGCNPTEEAAWTLGNLAAGESRTIAVNAFVDSVLSGNLISTPVRVTATDLGDTIDLLKTVALYNTPSADLALSASTDPVVPNETFTYQLDFGNTSGGSLSSVALRAFLPSGVTVSSISDGGLEVSTGEVVWNVTSISVGSALHREVEVIADDALAGDTLKFLAELTHNDGLEIDSRSEFAVSVAKSNGISSLLSVNIAATPNPVASNGNLAYTITVTNDFGLPVNAVNVLLRIPDELSFSASTDAEPNADGCGNGGCNPTEEAVWALGTMAAGASQVITINATVGSGYSDGTLIVAPVRVTATDMEDTINLQHITIIEN